MLVVMKMNKKQIITTTILCVALSTGGYILGKERSRNHVEKLEQKVQNTRTENKLIRGKNYGLHLDLIKNGNPYGWELQGDETGNWSYKRWIDYGTGGEYIHLNKNSYY